MSSPQKVHPSPQRRGSRALAPEGPGISQFMTNEERDPGVGFEREKDISGRGDYALYGTAPEISAQGFRPTSTLKRTQTVSEIKIANRVSRLKSKKKASSRQQMLGSLLAVVEEYGIRRKKTDFHAASSFPVLVPTGRLRKNWDLFCLVVLLYVCTVTPFSIAFIGDDLKSYPYWGILYFCDRFVDAVFMVDIVFNFRTAWLDVEGHRCFEWRECALKYMKGWLFVDVVSVIPYDLIELDTQSINSRSGEEQDQLLMLLKLLRILRIAKVMKILRAARILKRMEQQMSIKFGVVKLVKFFVLIIMVAHWMACTYYLAGSMQSDATAHESWINSHEYPAEYSIADMYVLALYWAIMTITTIGYGDIPSGTTSERMVAITSMIIGAGLFSYVVGTMTSLIQGLDISTRAFEDKMDSINEYMSLSNFPLHLRRRIRAYCFYQRDTKSFLPSERDLYASVSPALRSMCAFYKYQSLLKRVPYFAHAPTQVISELALLLKHAIYMPGECVMKAGEVGHVMYFMYKGRAHLEMIGRDNDPMILGLLTDGTHFGERGMLFSARRLHTVRCLSYCDTCIINGDDYSRLMRYHPDVRAEVRRMVVRKMWLHLTKSGKLRQAFERAMQKPMKPDEALDLNLMQDKLYEMQGLLAKQMVYHERAEKKKEDVLKAVVKRKDMEANEKVKKMRRETQRLKLSLTNARLASPRGGAGEGSLQTPQRGASEKSSVFQFTDEEIEASAASAVVQVAATEEDHMHLSRNTPPV